MADVKNINEPAFKPDKDSFGVEYGTDNDLPFSSPFSPEKSGISKNASEELYETLNYGYTDEGRPTVRQLTIMRRLDGQARALHQLITLPIRSGLSTAEIVPAEDGEEEAEFIEKVFFTNPESGGMTITFQRFMAQVLNGLFDGFSAFEKVFWRPTTGPLKGKITLKKLAYRPSETVTFVTSKEGSFRGFRQRSVNATGKSSDVYIPQEYAFYFAAQEQERKFYGVSYFETAFQHYTSKQKIYYLANLAAQRASVGTRIGSVPQSASKSQKQAFATALQSVSTAQWMMFDDTFKVQMLNEAGHFDFINFINHHNSMMSKTVLAAFFDSNQGAGMSEGTLVNFAKPGDGMFLMMLRAIQEDIAAQINHYIIPQLIDLNFKGQKYPKFSWGNLTDEQQSAIANTFDKLMTASSQINATPEFVRELEKRQAKAFGLSVDYDEVDAREAQEQAMADAQMLSTIPMDDSGTLASGIPGGGADTMNGGAPQIETDEDGSPSQNAIAESFMAQADAQKAREEEAKAQVAELSAISDRLNPMYMDQEMIRQAREAFGVTEEEFFNG